MPLLYPHILVDQISPKIKDDQSQSMLKINHSIEQLELPRGSATNRRPIPEASLAGIKDITVVNQYSKT